MLNAEQIKTIESKLNDLAKDNETYNGGVFNNRYRAYAQGIAFTLYEIGYVVEWEDGKAHVVKEH